MTECIEVVKLLRARFGMDSLEWRTLQRLAQTVHDTGFDRTAVQLKLNLPPLDGDDLTRRLLGPNASADAYECLRDGLINDDRAWMILCEHNETALLATLVHWVFTLGDHPRPSWYLLIVACGATGLEPLPSPSANAWTERGRNWAKRRQRIREEFTAEREARVLRKTVNIDKVG